MNPWYIITYTEYDNSNAYFRNSENEEDLYQNINYASRFVNQNNIIYTSMNWGFQKHLVHEKIPYSCHESYQIKFHESLLLTPQNFIAYCTVNIFDHKTLWCSTFMITMMFKFKPYYNHNDVQIHNMPLWDVPSCI